MSRYRDIFFDLDRTLWDFDRNSEESLFELHAEFSLTDKLGVTLKDFVSQFHKLNAEAWQKFRNGKQSKEKMREQRFIEVFRILGSNDRSTAIQLSNRYLEVCPLKSHLMEGAKEVLDELIKVRRIHLITNGFGDVQRQKLKAGDLNKYLSQIIISEETPYRKPQREIFHLAMKKAGASLKSSLMVGDDFEKDIIGAIRAGMDQVYYNPKQIKASDKRPSHEISQMKELLKIALD